MKHINILLTIGVIVLVNTSCATLNRAHGELNYNNHISKGQELQDLNRHKIVSQGMVFLRFLLALIASD